MYHNEVKRNVNGLTHGHNRLATHEMTIMITDVVISINIIYKTCSCDQITCGIAYFTLV